MAAAEFAARGGFFLVSDGVSDGLFSFSGVTRSHSSAAFTQHDVNCRARE
jgi:hypothetical protein